jgi:branched-chain amino acid transport system substrate-binding protein
MMKITRRFAVGAMAAALFAMPGIIRAQSTSRPVRIGLLSDMGGPYRDVGGPGNRLAVELAIEDFGGSVLGRQIEVLQGDDQNKPDVASALAREWIDSQAVDALADGAASSAGLAIQQVCREKAAHLFDHRPGDIRHDRQAVLAVRHPLRLRYLRAGARHRVPR